MQSTERMNPTAPTIIRITPMVWILKPLVLTFTAKRSTAPTAIKKSEVPKVIAKPPWWIPFAARLSGMGTAQTIQAPFRAEPIGFSGGLVEALLDLFSEAIDHVVLPRGRGGRSYRPAPGARLHAGAHRGCRDRGDGG